MDDPFVNNAVNPWLTQLLRNMAVLVCWRQVTRLLALASSCIPTVWTITLRTKSTSLGSHERIHPVRAGYFTYLNNFAA